RGGDQASRGRRPRRVDRLRGGRAERDARAGADRAATGAPAAPAPGRRAPPRQGADARAGGGAGRPGPRGRALSMQAPRRRRAGFVQSIQARNVIGAVLAFLYFRVIDPMFADRPVSWADIAFFVVGFTLLAGSGVVLGLRLTAPLRDPERQASAAVRRAALLYPYHMTAITLIGWALAGLLFGLFWPWLTGTLTPRGAVRSLFGITVIGGGV